MTRPLEDKIALVTGASRGIGRAIAEELSGRGAHVIVNFRQNEIEANKVVAAIVDRGGRAEARQADVGDSEQATSLVRGIEAAHGRIDVIVNNAGLQRSALVHKTSDEDWNAVVATNLSSVFYLCRAALPGMYARGIGSIVNVASASSVVAQRGAAAYVASKHALVGLTKVLALEAASKGVLVNAVAPGLTETDLLGGLSDAQRAGLLSLVPLARIAAPEEIARMVAFVVCEARYSTGNVFHASGGVVLG